MATPCRRRSHAYPCYIIIMLPMLACCLLRRTVAQSQPTGEAEVLLQMKRAWGDPPVLAAWNWSAATSGAGAHCSWPYVVCDSAGRVTMLALGSMNITGPVPDAVGSLYSLEFLDLSNNIITGMFPMALYRCRSLRYLDVSCNYLVGELPDDIGRGLWANLSTLNLGSNEFNGSIPANLGYGMPMLKKLYLSNNKLSGRIS